MIRLHKVEKKQTRQIEDKEEEEFKRPERQTEEITNPRGVLKLEAHLFFSSKRHKKQFQPAPSSPNTNPKTSPKTSPNTSPNTAQLSPIND